MGTGRASSGAPAPALCALWALVVVLCSMSPAFAAPERLHLSSDPRVQEARAFIESGRFDEALTILRPLAPDHPDRTDVLFLIGLAATEASGAAGAGETERAALLDEAIAALRAILIGRPGLMRVRLELARALFLKGDDDLSRAHFKRVLAGDPPPVMAANIRRFLETMKARRRWNGYFGAALAPDSNIGAASDDRIIHIQGLPFRLDEESGARSGVGVVVQAGGEYQHPLNQTDDGGFARARTSIVGNTPETTSTEPCCRVMSARAGWPTGIPKRAS